MRITTADVTNIKDASTALVAEALSHLDCTFDYLHTPNEPDTDPPGAGVQETGGLQAGTNTIAANGNGADALSGDATTPVSGDRVRTDFGSDPFAHTETASRIGRMLQIFSVLAAQGMWMRHTSAAIAEHGEATTAAHVLHRMTSTLASRTVQQNAPGRDRDPTLKLYSQLITEQLAGICTMLTTIVDTAPYMAEIYNLVAPKLGCTLIELDDRLKAQDLVAMRTVAAECVEWTERKWREKGGELDAATRATFRAMAGLQPSGPLGDEQPMSLGDALGMLGLDPASATEIAPGVHVMGLSNAGDRPFTPPLAGSAAETDHIRVG
jgi:hypothetical protein